MKLLRHRKLCLLAFLNLILSCYPTSLVILFISDKRNTNLASRGGLPLWDRRSYYEDFEGIGFYPMGGIMTLLIASIFDVFAIITYLSGTICNTNYEKNYARFNIMNIFLTVTGAIMLLVTDNDANEYMNNYFKKAIMTRYVIEFDPNDKEFNLDCNFVDTVQSWQNCCGFASPLNWTQSKHWDPKTKLLPYSCCEESTKEDCILNSESIHRKGCYNLVYPTFNGSRRLAKAAAICKFFIIIAIMICSAIVFREKWEIPNKPLISRALSAKDKSYQLIKS